MHSFPNSLSIETTLSIEFAPRAAPCRHSSESVCIKPPYMSRVFMKIAVRGLFRYVDGFGTHSKAVFLRLLVYGIFVSFVSGMRLPTHLFSIVFRSELFYIMCQNVILPAYRNRVAGGRQHDQ